MLGNLPRTTAGNVLKRTAMKAAEPIRAMAARMAPDDPKTGAPDLRTSIVIQAGKSSRYSTAFHRTVYVGVSAPLVKNQTSGIPTGRSFYAKALEFGQGHMPMRPYMRPAWEGSKDAALGIVKETLAAEIAKAVARRAKKGL